MSGDVGSGRGPLSGIRVVELAALGAVPHAAMMLADAGADVLRIDRRPDPTTADDIVERGRRGNAVTRSRRSLIADLKHPDAANAVLGIVARADVVLEGFRPGVTERLGIGPADCLAVNPAIVYGRLTGWGRTGPLAARAGHDINYLALSGTLGAIGAPGELPQVPLNVIADFGGGSMQLAFGVVAALVEALRTGRGQVVDAAMLDGVASLTTYVHSMRAAGTWNDERASNVLDGGAPFYGTYATSDGRAMAVGAIEPAFYAALLRGLELDPASLPAQLDRDAWPAVRELIAQRFRTRTMVEWEAAFDGVDACVTPVLTMGEAPTHDHVVAHGTFTRVDGVVQPAPTPRFGNGDPVAPRAPVPPGTNGLAALEEWGVAAAAVDGWLASGAIASA